MFVGYAAEQVYDVEVLLNGYFNTNLHTDLMLTLTLILILTMTLLLTRILAANPWFSVMSMALQLWD